MLFTKRLPVPKDEVVEEAELKRRQRIIEVAMENLERANRLAAEADDASKPDDAAQYSDLAGDWFDRLTGRSSYS